MVSSDWDKVRADASAAYLRHAAKAAAKLAGIDARYEALFGDLGPGGIDYSKPLAGIPYADALPDEVMRMLDLKHRYEEERAECMGIVAEASELVMSLDDPDQALALTRRFLMGDPWKAVAHALGMSTATARRRVDAGLVSLYALLPHTWQLPHHPAL